MNSTKFTHHSFYNALTFSLSEKAILFPNLIFTGLLERYLLPYYYFHLFILVVYQYSCWKFPYVAFSLLVSFCERFEIVWRSRVSITQGVIELKKKKKKHCAFQQCAHVNDFCWLHWEFCYMIWLLHAGTLGKPNLWNTYWEQHKQFHNEALAIKILLKVTKDRRNQWLPRRFLVNEID